MYDYREQLDAKTTLTRDERPILDKRDSTVSAEDVDLTLTLDGLADVAAGTEWTGLRDARGRPEVRDPHALDRRAPRSVLPRVLGLRGGQAPPRSVGGRPPRAARLGVRRPASCRRAPRHGPFDLVFFLGVLYHSAFHLELLGMLNRVTRLGGEMLLETTTDPRPDSALRVRWQPGTGKAKMVPTFDALRIELAWTGWRDVTVFTDYRPESDEVLVLCSEDGRARRRRGRRRRRSPPARQRRAGVSPRVAAALTLAGIVLAAVAALGGARTADRGPDGVRRRADPLGRVALARGGRRAPRARRRLWLRPGYPALLAPVHLLTGDDLSAYSGRGS